MMLNVGGASPGEYMKIQLGPFVKAAFSRVKGV